jgi:hypothetical protein
MVFIYFFVVMTHFMLKISERFRINTLGLLGSSLCVAVAKGNDNGCHLLGTNYGQSSCNVM